MDLLPIRRAILSVTDKYGLVEFAAYLADHKVELVSTGGTFKVLTDAGLRVVPISDVTNFPEILGGRVKTLHPAVHAGILADKDNAEHSATLKEHKIEPFDLVCVNLYNFAEAIKKNLPPKEAVEQIDIGGPCMLRAAAKNYHSVLVVPAPSSYQRIKEALNLNEFKAPLGLRRELAAETFAAVSTYDAMIAAYLAEA